MKRRKRGENHKGQLRNGVCAREEMEDGGRETVVKEERKRVGGGKTKCHKFFKFQCMREFHKIFLNGGRDRISQPLEGVCLFEGCHLLCCFGKNFLLLERMP